MTIQEQLDDLRRKVEMVTVRCDAIGGCTFIEDGGECSRCHRTGRVPNPRLAPLREALREWHTTSGCNDYAGCRRAHPSYITRDVSGWPEWAVKGLVLGAAYDCHFIFESEIQRRFVGNTPTECIVAVSEAVDALREERP